MIRGINFDAAAEVAAAPIEAKTDKKSKAKKEEVIAPVATTTPTPTETPAPIVQPTTTEITDPLLNLITIGDDAPKEKPKTLNFHKLKEIGLLDEVSDDIDDDSAYTKLETNYKKLQQDLEFAKIAAEVNTNLEQLPDYKYFDSVAKHPDSKEVYKAKLMSVNKLSAQEAQAKVDKMLELENGEVFIEQAADDYRLEARKNIGFITEAIAEQKKEARKNLISNSTKVNSEASDILAKSEMMMGFNLTKEAHEKLIKPTADSLKNGDFDKKLQDPKKKAEIAFAYENFETLKKVLMAQGKNKTLDKISTSPTVSTPSTASNTQTKAWAEMTPAERVEATKRRFGG